MAKTQDFLLISDIIDDVVLLKDGGGVIILEANAVNFELLSDQEQVAIVQSFAQLLNSLSFAIQIVVHSARLDISSYLGLLDKAQKAQVNPLLSAMMLRYRAFIQSTVKENNVLDKSFFVVIKVDEIELGLNLKLKPQDRIMKLKAMLYPRRDQLFRQLSRVGVRASTISRDKLIKIFYNAYNANETWQAETPINQVKLNLPVQPATPMPAKAYPVTQVPPQAETDNQIRSSRNHPFVVEELTDSP